MNDKKESILKHIRNLAGNPEIELKPETELVADLGIDSPKALQLLVEIEDTLDIEISDDEAAEIKTVGDVLKYCEIS